ncbi:hypothetical protein V8G54_021484 [Vigna mungo]|uniref:Uncharacterized protein n=1 Tax=Vigna mungo TaxID=3915 RepID=A0AAQ3NHG8_VIGMU
MHFKTAPQKQHIQETNSPCIRPKQCSMIGLKQSFHQFIQSNFFPPNLGFILAMVTTATTILPVYCVGPLPHHTGQVFKLQTHFRSAPYLHSTQGHSQVIAVDSHAPKPTNVLDNTAPEIPLKPN